MAYKINANECTACGACEFECPNAAVSEDSRTGAFKIDPSLCTECEGLKDKPACVSACPVSGCIVQIAA